MNLIYVRGTQYKFNDKCKEPWRLLESFEDGEQWYPTFYIAQMHYGKDNVKHETTS